MTPVFFCLRAWPVVGLPFTTAEVNHPFPHRFAARGYVTLTAAGLMWHRQDVA